MGVVVDVAGVGDVPPGTGLVVEAERHVIAVFNDGGRFYALDNTCTHRGGPLADGEVAEGRVTCPWHGAEFDLATGQALAPPARQPIIAYRVVVVGDRVKVEF
jgi:nitrite reductase (NADH) small subunit